MRRITAQDIGKHREKRRGIHSGDLLQRRRLRIPLRIHCSRAGHDVRLAPLAKWSGGQACLGLIHGGAIDLNLAYQPAGFGRAAHQFNAVRQNALPQKANDREFLCKNGRRVV